MDSRKRTDPMLIPGGSNKDSDSIKKFSFSDLIGKPGGPCLFQSWVKTENDLDLRRKRYYAKIGVAPTPLPDNISPTKLKKL